MQKYLGMSEIIRIFAAQKFSKKHFSLTKQKKIADRP